MIGKASNYGGIEDVLVFTLVFTLLKTKSKFIGFARYF